MARALSGKWLAMMSGLQLLGAMASGDRWGPRGCNIESEGGGLVYGVEVFT